MDNQNQQQVTESPRIRYLIAAILILAAVALGWWVWQNQIDRLISPLPPPPVATTTDVIDVDTSTWETYRNDKYGFEIKYPAYINYVGFYSTSSELNSYQDPRPVTGVHVGELLFILVDDNVQQKISQLYNFDGFLDTIENSNVNMKYRSVCGEGGCNFTALISGDTKKVFVDGYGYKFPDSNFSINEGNIGFKSDSDRKLSLSTFQFIETPSLVEPITTPTLTKELSSGWIEYVNRSNAPLPFVNQTYKWSIEIPVGWSVSDCHACDPISSRGATIGETRINNFPVTKNNGHLHLEINPRELKWYPAGKLDDWCDIDSTSGLYGQQLLRKDKIEFFGHNACRFLIESSGSEGEVTEFSTDSYHYSLRFVTYPAEYHPEPIRLNQINNFSQYRKILSTFRFIE